MSNRLAKKGKLKSRVIFLQHCQNKLQKLNKLQRFIGRVLFADFANYHSRDYRNCDTTELWMHLEGLLSKQ